MCRWTRLCAVILLASARLAAAPAEPASVSDTLVAQGLADTSGCEYRFVDGGGRRYQAWVPPTGSGPLRAIGWDGVARPVDAVLGASPLVADAEYLEAAAGELPTFDLDDAELGPWRIVDPREPLDVPHSPLAACLLWRAGRPVEANRAWAAWQAGAFQPASIAPPPTDGYLTAAQSWISALYRRATDCHARADDAEALAALRLLTRAMPLVEAEAKRRGLRLPAAAFGLPVVRGYLDDLPDAPALLADQERRLLPAAAPADPIEALIAGLDELTPDRAWPDDPARLGAGPEALMAQGTAAVEPLLRCLADDQRLTRGFTVNSRFRGHQYPVPVWSVAHRLLAAILDTTFGERTGAGPEARAALTERATTFWRKYGGLPLSERWYRILADDADRAGWLEAADRLTRRDDHGRLAGEPLRGKRGPSVADLLTRRMRECALGARTPDWNDPAGYGYLLALALGTWQGPASLPELRWMSSRLAVVGGSPDNPTYDLRLVTLCERRAALGDATALPEYASWVQRVGVLAQCPVQAFELFWRHPDHPALATASRRLFEEAKSPWNPATQPARWLLAARDPGQAPLLAVPAWRRGWLAALSNREQSDGGRICDQLAHLLSSTWGLPPCDLDWPLDRRDQAVAACASVVRRYGPRFRGVEVPNAYLTRAWRAVLDLPRLERPAEQADVDAGRAVFALGHQRATRVVALPAQPTGVVWVQPDGAAGPGQAQQAEERLERGGWRRYIGYVGELGMAMVPAEQIEYAAPPNEHWTSLGGGLDARLLGPEPDQPTSVTLWLRNRRAVPLRTHTVWLRPTAEGLAGLRQGIVLQVTGRPSNPPAPVLEARRGFPDAGWLRDLAPGETLNAGRLDLRRVYGELAPGVYSVLLDVSGVTGRSFGADRVWTRVTVAAP
ncbi:MAG: hypothetical protein HZB16_05495 [Armatimonadetes bacterium]|nr:hypothetical protein [Armatimonadota bacterium]